MYHVRVTTSLLADAATVCDGKLYVHGAGWDVINGPGLPVMYPAFAVVLVIEMDVSELTGDDVQVVLVDDEASQLVTMTGHLETADPARYAPRTSIKLPLALPFQGLTFARTGNYAFKVSVGGTEIHSLDFSVHTPPQ
jgi:hypothetical protein